MSPGTALVTGGASGIGRAIVERLERGGAEVRVLDLQDGFDVSDPAAWESVDAVDLACLNAGVVTGESRIGDVTDAAYRRIMGTNVDGVVFGVRRLARVVSPESPARASPERRGSSHRSSPSNTVLLGRITTRFRPTFVASRRSGSESCSRLRLASLHA